MKRRDLLRMILATPAALPALAAGRASPALPTDPPSPVNLQESFLAGFQYYYGRSVWPLLRVGDPLRLEREPANRYDSRAVAVYWSGRKLGYVPRVDNASVAYMMDRRMGLRARIIELMESTNPWLRVRFSVYVEL